MKTQAIIQNILTASDNDLQAALYALEDGFALEQLGYTDDDQEDIECAHDVLAEMLKASTSL
jgi:hypothetical protein